MTDSTLDPRLDPAPPVSGPAPGPGAMIRAGRERARISLEDLASQLKLSRHTLEALESDAFDRLLEPVYVRGYYRKCAKVLGLSDKELLEAYDAHVAPAAPSAPSKLRLASGSELGSGNRLPVWMGAIAALAGVMLVAFCWNLFKSPSRTPPALPVPTTETPPPAPVLKLDEAVTPVTQPQAQLQSPSSAPAETAPSTAAPAPSAAATEATITLSFGSTSWARVIDARGKTLLNALMNAGDQRSVSGAPPLAVSLGRAERVAVTYDGKPVDISGQVAKNLTAHFSLPLEARP